MIKSLRDAGLGVLMQFDDPENPTRTDEDGIDDWRVFFAEKAVDEWEYKATKVVIKRENGANKTVGVDYTFYASGKYMCVVFEGGGCISAYSTFAGTVAEIFENAIDAHELRLKEYVDGKMDFE